MEAIEVLVVILSIFLAIFLVLAIALLVMFLSVARKINRTADNIERFTGNLGSSLAKAFKDNLTPAAVMAGLFKVSRKVYKRKDKEKGD